MNFDELPDLDLEDMSVDEIILIANGFGKVQAYQNSPKISIHVSYKHHTATVSMETQPSRKENAIHCIRAAQAIRDLIDALEAGLRDDDLD